VEFRTRTNSAQWRTACHTEHIFTRGKREDKKKKDEEKRRKLGRGKGTRVILIRNKRKGLKVTKRREVGEGGKYAKKRRKEREAS